MEILWKIVNFIILFGALYLVCRKMNLFDKMFGSRRRGIGDEIESSEKAKAQAKALGADIDKVRAENEERKQQLLKDAEAQAKADGEAIAASGEEEAKSILANAEKSVERRFAEDMDSAEEVCVYAKLPRGFHIPTPVGNYSPDWAIAFHEGTVKHIFFIAETKGTMSSLSLRPIEKAKILCAKKLFNEISTENIKYHDVENYQNLLSVMKSL